MSHLKSISIFLIIIFSTLWKGNLQAQEANRFNVSFEYHKTEADYLKNNSYLKMIFTISEQEKNKYEAILKKGILSENKGSYPPVYFDTDFPFTKQGKQPFNVFTLLFYQKNAICFHLENGKVIIDNAAFLSSKFSNDKKKKGGKLRTSRTEESTNGYFSMQQLSVMFQQMFVTLPDDLLAPKDLSLWKGNVYNYLQDFDQFKNVEVTKIKQHEKVNLFVNKNSSLIRYALITNLSYKMIVRTFPETEKTSFQISGQFLKSKNATIHCKLESLAPFASTKDTIIKTNAKGKFTLQAEAHCPVILYTENGFIFYTEPGDQFSFYSNQTQDTLFFSGIGAANNNYLQAEGRLKKIPEGNFKKIDTIINSYFRLINSYRNEITPTLFEKSYLNYYFGTINHKIQFLFTQIEYSPKDGRIIPRTYTGLDTIPVRYQSFTLNSEYCKYLGYNLIIHFEKLRDFRFAQGYTDPYIPHEDELVALASLTYSGKTLQDYLSHAAIRIALIHDSKGLEEIKRVVDEKFSDTEIQANISKLIRKTKRIENGTTFPAVKFLDLNKKSIEISAFKGKIIYMMFWRNNAFVFDKQWEDYQMLISSSRSDSVLFINVGLEEDFNKWKSYVEGMNFPGINLFINRESDDFSKYFQYMKSRHYFLIDKNGTVINNNGPEPSVANLLITSAPNQSKREKTLLGGLLFFAALGLISGLVWLISRQRRKRRMEIANLLTRLRETELKAIKAQMNPHFLFNSLNSIQNLINQQNIEEANLYLSKFAKLLRSVLQHSEKEIIPLADELETIKLYIELEKLRFNFEFTLEIPSNLDIYNTFIPPLLVQPFLENAILHGLQPKKGEKLLTVKFFEQGQELFCQITDNGVGMNNQTKSSSAHTGMGNKLSIERINLLNKKNNSNFKLQIETLNTATEKTRVTISYLNNLI